MFIALGVYSLIATIIVAVLPVMQTLPLTLVGLFITTSFFYAAKKAHDYHKNTTECKICKGRGRIEKKEVK